MNHSLSKKFHEYSQQEEPYEQKKEGSLFMSTNLNHIEQENTQKSRYLQPPNQLPKRAYSLQPDMANGWKPKKHLKVAMNNVFNINYHQTVVDQIVRELYKSKRKHKYSLVYLGPRKGNSYSLHEDRSYKNPYPIDKKLQIKLPERIGLPHNPKIGESKLTFNSDFQSGNLDVAIDVGENQYDLFMRVDSNTRGHTNWFYFSVQNHDFVGKVKLNICNFRREKSLYQRNLKPFVFSKISSKQWQQSGTTLGYSNSKLRYQFLYEDQDFLYMQKYDNQGKIKHPFYNVNDEVRFSYCIPYTFTRLNKLLKTLQNIEHCPPIKTLSGLNIPIVKITDQSEPEYNKKIILVTARIHPGQSNSSFVCEGLLEYITSNEQIAINLRKLYIFYVVPMLNPDGVIAGNYRTSLFGKDLNRTYDQSRKFAFPETFHLLEFAKELKNKHKKRFSIYIDLHGHSVKKNVFMYGPDFSIQHSYYSASRQIPKILGNLTKYFRYYSCIFRISSQKSTTARAVMNRFMDIPFTFTMQSSNGFYYDNQTHTEIPFNAKKWKEMGACLGMAFYYWKVNKKCQIKRSNSQNLAAKQFMQKQTIPESQKNSDDQISEGNSDSQPQDQDLEDKQLDQIQNVIEGKKNKSPTNRFEKTKYDMKNKSKSKQLFKDKKSNDEMKTNVYLPPINTITRANIFSNRQSKRQMIRQQRLRNVESQLEGSLIEKPTQKRTKIALSALVVDIRGDIVQKNQPKSAHNAFIKREKEVQNSRFEFIQKLKSMKSYI